MTVDALPGSSWPPTCSRSTPPRPSSRTSSPTTSTFALDRSEPRAQAGHDRRTSTSSRRGGQRPARADRAVHRQRAERDGDRAAATASRRACRSSSGLQGDSSTEILSGLKAGQTVVLPTAEHLVEPHSSSPVGSTSTTGGPGGGFRGGGVRRRRRTRLRRMSSARAGAGLPSRSRASRRATARARSPCTRCAASTSSSSRGDYVGDHGRARQRQVDADEPHRLPRRRRRSGRYLLDGHRRQRARRRRARLSSATARSASSSRASTSIPRTSALRNVELPLIYARVPGRSGGERALAALAAVGLADRACAPAAGALRRPAAAGRDRARDRHRPALILADEPTGNLDSASQQRDHADLRRPQRRRTDDRDDHPRARRRRARAADDPPRRRPIVSDERRGPVPRSRRSLRQRPRRSRSARSASGGAA